MNEVTEILSSENPSGDRLWTALLVGPKFNHQETLRHRTLYIEDCLYDPDFSFSVSSSRAIPFTKTLAEVRSDELRAAPVYWGAEQKGMSPGEELDDSKKTIDWGAVVHSLGNPHTPDSYFIVSALDPRSIEYITPRECSRRLWDMQAKLCARVAEAAVHFTHEHKSIANRRIETFVHVRAGLTGTTRGWMNFFGLRLDGAADPTLRDLAEKAWALWNESKPKKLLPGQWHLPFVDEETMEELMEPYTDDRGSIDPRIQVSVARFARLSYLSFETQKRSTIEEDTALYNRLVGSSPIHASPAEHQATPDKGVTRIDVRSYGGVYSYGSQYRGWEHPEQAGNLGPGWRQFRKMLPNESVAPLPERYRK